MPSWKQDAIEQNKAKAKDKKPLRKGLFSNQKSVLLLFYVIVLGPADVAAGPVLFPL